MTYSLYLSTFILLFISTLFAQDKIGPNDIIQKYGPPKEIIERALKHEVEYIYPLGSFIFKKGVLLTKLAASNSKSLTKVSGGHKLIKAGEKALPDSPEVVDDILVDLSKESTETKGSASPEAPTFQRPDVNSDF